MLTLDDHWVWFCLCFRGLNILLSFVYVIVWLVAVALRLPFLLSLTTNNDILFNPLLDGLGLILLRLPDEYGPDKTRVYQLKWKQITWQRSQCVRLLYLELPDARTSYCGCSLFTGLIVVILGSMTSAISCPVLMLKKSIGCSAIPL